MRLARGTGNLRLQEEVVAVATVWTTTNSPYRASAATAAKASWAGGNSGPGRLVVKVGSTRQSVARVVTVARAVADPRR